MSAATPAPVITHELCEAFSEAADAIARRRAGAIAATLVDDCVALRWMEWHGGSLRLTPLGHMALIRIRARTEEAAA